MRTHCSVYCHGFKFTYLRKVRPCYAILMLVEELGFLLVGLHAPGVGHPPAHQGPVQGRAAVGQVVVLRLLGAPAVYDRVPHGLISVCPEKVENMS